jgi:hypothetical protein
VTTAEAATGAGGGAPAIRRKRPATIVLAEAMLMLEAFLLVFATLVGYGLRVAPSSAVWGAGLGAAAVLGLLSGVQRWRAGRVAGSVAQVAVLAGGFWVPTMFAVGGLFVVLWFAMLRLGARIDRERAAFDAAHPDAVEPPRPPRAH